MTRTATGTNEIQVQGQCDVRFNRVREVFAGNFREGLEVGASFAATVDGELVVDLWGGVADATRNEPWRRDTIANVWSTTKGMAAICIHVLADRGLLAVTDPVAKHWPAFAQNGKQGVTIAHVLSHQAGLPDVTPSVSFATLYDHRLMAEMLEREAPFWEPGTRTLYHALTYGYLLGEIVVRVTGRSLGTYFREEIAEPLNADFHIGVGAALDPRVATMIPYEPDDPWFSEANALSGGDDPVLARLQMSTLMRPNMGICNERDWRAAEIPGANGHGNARALARIMSALACDGAVDGIRLMHEETIDRATALQDSAVSYMGGQRTDWGLGFLLGGEDTAFTAAGGPRTFGHSGSGGSIAAADRDLRVSWGYVMNRMDSSERGTGRKRGLEEAFYRCL